MNRQPLSPKVCPICGGYLATIGNKTRECEQCGYRRKEKTK
ncbi:MAG: hypothetical protein AB7D06_08790 [Pedobacter sp.]